MAGTSDLRITIEGRGGAAGGTEVSAVHLHPNDATHLMVLGHGAGAGMRHTFMEAIAGLLAERRVATLRYQFPYTEQGRRRPDPRSVLLATVRAAVAAGRDLAGEGAPGGESLPLIAGGKSMGGRMTSLAAAQEPLEGVRGIAFIGFPLHGVGKPPSDERAAHLADVGVPTLFLQGTRDKLADLDLLRPVVAGLGAAATLHVLDDADHGFHVLKRTGRTDDEVLAELADTIAAWAGGLRGAE